MGSWNATCGVTQLPITAGDRVVLVPLIVKQPDFLARDNLGGTGSTSNDCIAQPFSLPIAGEYDDYGGIAADDGHLALKYLMQALQDWVDDDQALVRIKSGKPHPVTKLDEDVLDELMRGELHVLVPNTRKGWLKGLRDTYAQMSDEEKPGFSHYLPQMEIDPDTLPDRLSCPLGGMFVPESLYHGLVDVEAVEEAVGYWDDKTKALVKLGNTRREELEQQTSLSQAQRDKMAEARKAFEQAVADDELDADIVEPLLRLLPMQAMPNPARMNGDYFYGGDVADAIVVDAALNDDAALRKLWVDFMLFSCVFYAMRKHWTPQPGAGSSCGLYETAKLYRVAQAFMAQSLARYAEELAEETA